MGDAGRRIRNPGSGFSSTKRTPCRRCSGTFLSGVACRTMSAPSPGSILIATPSDVSAVALETALKPLASVILARTGAEARRQAEDCRPAVALVDLRFPGGAAEAVVRSLRDRPAAERCPVILVTDEPPAAADLSGAYALGAADLVLLPTSALALRAKVAAFIELQREKAAVAAHARAEPAAAGLQERFRLLMETASDIALLFTDPDGRISDWTAGAQTLLGYASAEAVGQPIDLIFTAADRAAGAPAAERRQAAAEGQARDERWHVRKDGSTFFANGRLVALRRAGGSLRGFAKVVRDATSQVELAESEARFRRIFETANEGIWILDAEGRIELANDRMGEMLGCTADEMRGRDRCDFTFPEDRRQVEAMFEERRRGVAVHGVDIRFRHRDGGEVWMLLSARPVFQEGAFAGALDMFTDNTERRAAERASRAAAEQFRVFFESGATGHVHIDPVTKRFIHTNERFREITGYTAEELGRMTYIDLTHPDDRGRDTELVAQLYDGSAREIHVEKRYCRRDHSEVWVEVTATLVRDAAGTPVMQISVVQDVDARKHAEAAQRATEAQLRVAIDAAELGTFLFEPERERVHWSDRTRNLLGFPPGEPESMDRFFSRVHPEDRPRTEERWAYALRAPEGEDLNAEFRVVLPGGAVRHLTAAGRVIAPPSGRGGRLVVGTLRDVTERRLSEADLQRKVDERTAALQEKTNQLEAFLYTVAHDLRSPLRAISGYAELAVEDFGRELPDGATGYLGRIRTSAQRLDGLIRDLLTYSRIAQVDLAPENVPLGASVEWAVREFEREIAAKQAVVEVAPDLPTVVAERSLVDQVMLNLISNALKFVPAGVPPRVRISATGQAGGMVRVQVADNGIGIAPEHHARIFRVFERLKDAAAYPGTGVGLAIVARAADRLGGRVGVESRQGGGSTFWVELRRAAR